jgi:hypothetical protein
MPQPQSFKNHTKFDPLFHFVLAPAALVMAIVAIVHCIGHPSLRSAAYIALAVFDLLAIFKLRLYALKVQDRVIRLEERLRLTELAPALHGKIGDLTEDQLIGLRFASDGEVAGLAAQTLAGNWKRKQIKEGIKNWRADHWRV